VSGVAAVPLGGNSGLVVTGRGSCPEAERRAGGDGRTRTRLKAAGGCGMGAVLPLRSLLGKAEKMGSRPEGCVFYSLDTKGGRPYLHIIWVMFRSEACGARNITKLRLC